MNRSSIFSNFNSILPFNLHFISKKVYCKGVCVHEHVHGTHSTIYVLLRDRKISEKPAQKGGEGECVPIMCTHAENNPPWGQYNTRCVHTSIFPILGGVLA